MEVTFKFWTNLCPCYGPNIDGTVTVEMTPKQLARFEEALDSYWEEMSEELERKEQENNEQTGDDCLSVYEEIAMAHLLGHLSKHLPKGLYEKIYWEIAHIVNRQMTADAIAEMGYELLGDSEEANDVTYEDWEAMSEDEQIDCVIRANPGVPDFEVTDIEILDDDEATEEE